MPRKPRLNIPNGVYHVMNRGIERRNIVKDDVDRGEWKRLFARTAVQRGWRVHAWALLNNHFHLFVRTPAGDLSDGMHDFQSGHATLFNKRHSRTGYLFQGRFKAELVDSDEYAWSVSRYIHLNPVRAGLCTNPQQYSWCSYRDYLNPRLAPAWLDWGSVLSQLSGTEAAARLAYKQFVDSGVEHPVANPFDDVVDGWILGNEQFVAKFSEAGEDVVAASFDQVLTLVAREFDVPEEMVVRARGRQFAARDALVLLARDATPTPANAVADRLGIGKSAVTEIVKRARKQMDVDEEFAERVGRVRERLGGE